MNTSIQPPAAGQAAPKEKRFYVEQRKSLTVHDEKWGWWDVKEDSDGVVVLATVEDWAVADSIKNAMVCRGIANEVLARHGFGNIQRDLIAVVQAVADEVRAFPDSPRSYSSDSYLPRDLVERLVVTLQSAKEAL
jgi:hypothetical protein